MCQNTKATHLNQNKCMEKHDINTIYAQYQEFINSNCTGLKEEAELIIRQKRLKLQTAILSITGFKPAYSVQLLTDEIEYLPVFGKVPTYLGDWELLYENWEYAPPPFFNIKWMAIQPLFEIYRGRLVKPEIIDKSDILLDILHQCHIPFEKEDEHTFVIYGYK